MSHDSVANDRSDNDNNDTNLNNEKKVTKRRIPCQDLSDIVVVCYLSEYIALLYFLLCLWL